MPGRDGTGPWGRGSGTGRGRGVCVPSGKGGCFAGRGGLFGMGRNARYLFSSVNDEASELKTELEMINARLAEIEKEKK
ncbi:MAG: DUF5320 family protein [Candidatus Margulisbacteria bacterium]|nr:DUF5320 family protein [Candidatus Margulisiibacteriota bacterium]MBU1616309.1 DUF5320 family protein [Candidatus Margulisiibacteriota bacterium]MBU1867580.1 DUF5320 family protein [Candidatus Margulisiibacteriota bacterium]